MNKLLILLFAFALLLNSLSVAAQSQPVRLDTIHATADSMHSKATTTTSASSDDGPNGSLLLAIFLLGILVAAALFGTVVLIGFLLILFALISAGILSTSILVGMYRRSVMAGFRTLLMIACSLAGMFTGALGLYLLHDSFPSNWKINTTLLIGAAGGLLGGLVLGLIIFYIIRKFLQFCRQRFSWPE